MKRLFRRTQLAPAQPIRLGMPAEKTSLPDSSLALDTAIRETARRPLSLFRPTPYESKYAYPLLVWLFGEQEDEKALLRLMPRVSPHNFGAIGLRGTTVSSLPGIGDASEAELDYRDLGRDRDFDLFSAVGIALRHLHIHTERIFLVGVGEGSMRALRYGLSYPDCFAGIAALGGSFPPSSVQPLADLRRARRLPIFLAHPTSQQAEGGMLPGDSHRLLFTAGFQVESYCFQGPEVSSGTFEQLNRWIMSRLA